MLELHERMNVSSGSMEGNKGWKGNMNHTVQVMKVPKY